MASLGRKLEIKGVIAMTLLTLVLMNIGCEDKIDNPAINPSAGEMVEVSLNIGFAAEMDGYSLSAPSTTKSDAAAFNYTLQPTVATKGETTSIKPDKLYNLEIQQYDRSGNRIGGMANAIAEQVIGSALTLTLAANADCQLVIVAWGAENTTTRLGTGNLASAQAKSVAASTISGLQPAVQSDMNKMPYVLHLERACVENNTIKSVEGEGYDVRLLLRRLATRLTLNWSYSYSGYQLKQILLQSIPTDYKVVAAPDKIEKTYPSLLDQFTTIQLTAEEIAASEYSCWIPTNVRGRNPFATSQTYRIKSNAPTGSSYVDFIASNTTESMKKLSYRVYLGGSESSDFNLYSNTDYDYTVKINHTDLPINDRRVTIIDPIPASQSNENFVPTANCFMVVPGSAFCFDPFVYRQNGTDIENSTLKGWSDTEGGIAYVKLLWQTKENGDIGDPVMGVANSANDHTNILDIKKIGGGEVSSSSPVTDKGQARIYCRVAPNTTGGSGLIAAYNAKGEILWSWHVWVTDYAPDAKANASVDEPNKRVQKYTYGGKTQYPMMDRNLGALAGYTDVPEGNLARSKANGFHYQCGRKDPFPSSYSSLTKVTSITINSDKPTLGMLNLYQSDGVSYFARKARGNSVSLRVVYKTPTDTYSYGNGWCNETIDNFWNSSDNKKTVNDPCPAGWRIASKENYYSLFTNKVTTTDHSPMNMKNAETVDDDGGAVVFFEDSSEQRRSTYIRITGYQEFSDKFNYIGILTNLWCREISYAVGIIRDGYQYVKPGQYIKSWEKRDGHPLRCIQDR